MDKKLRNLIKNLAREEKLALSRLLERELNVPDIGSIRSELVKDSPIHCPHCQSSDVLGHGHYRGRRRYKCRSCGKTFNDRTGTAMDGIKKTEEFQEYLALLVESLSIRKAARQLGVNVKTIFDWRHKLLSALSAMNGQGFSGIVECDDKQLDINNKGERNLGRKPYKRPGDRQTKRGLSNDKVSLMVATDRNLNPTMRIAKVGRIDAESVATTIGGLLAPDNVLCSDSHPSIIKFARDRGLEHHTFIASKRHLKDRCYHVQHVNSLDNLYQRWIKPFYGVATKYLAGYLNWFVSLQKVKNSKSRVRELAKAVASNAAAIDTYRAIEERYLELRIPQYSKT